MARQGRCSFILPITDPYVVHHGALGSFAPAYLPQGPDREAIMKRLRAINGIYLVVGRKEGRRSFELPEDRLGDIIMLSSENTTIGTSEHRHNLAALNEPLRSPEASQSRLFPSSPTRCCPIDHMHRRCDISMPPSARSPRFATDLDGVLGAGHGLLLCTRVADIIAFDAHRRQAC
jgi:hypothetical protein